MKLLQRITCMLCAAALTIPAFPVQSASAASVTISPDVPYPINNGVFEGWGTSLCWWANRIGYSDSLSQKAADAFYGDEGLRMNIARFNIGGGDDPNHHHITRTDSNMPGYTVWDGSQFVYDWTQDARQRNVLLRSVEACGDGMIVEMFSNAPPYYMTKSGCSSGGDDPGKNNLKDDMYDEFADYLAEVCLHYEKDYGVHVQSVEAMNEPYTNFWGKNSAKQEGCHFDIGGSESTMILELQRAMEQRGLGDVLIAGTDETSIDTQIDAFKALSGEAKAAVDRIDTHTYGGYKRTELRDTALAAGKNLWMSEVDGGATAGKDNGEMGAALWLAERITADMNGLNPSAWILWQVIDNHISKDGMNGNKDKGMVNVNGGYWGCAVADHDNDTIILTKKYYAFGQYSRYIRPGMTMLQSGGNTLAAFDPETGRVVVTAYNTDGSAQELNVRLAGFESVGSTAQVIRTSNSESWAELPAETLDGTLLHVSLAPNSVTTFLIDDCHPMPSPTDGLNRVTPVELTGTNSWKDQESSDFHKAFDGSTGTFFDGLGAGWVCANLGEVYHLKTIGYCPRSGYEYRMVDGYFEVSENGTDWTKVYTVTDKPSSGMQYARLDGVNARYVRYAVPEGTPNNGVNKDNVYCCNIAEIELYAEPPVEAEPMTGDVNADGSIDVLDAVLLQKYIHGSAELPAPELADVCDDGEIDIFDLALLKKMLLS